MPYADSKVEGATAGASYAYLSVGYDQLRLFRVLIVNNGANELTWKVEADMDAGFANAQSVKAEATLAATTSTHTSYAQQAWKFVRVGYKATTATQTTTCSVWINAVP